MNRCLILILTFGFSFSCTKYANNSETIVELRNDSTVLEYHVLNGLKHGPFKIKNELGNVIVSGNYENGEYHGAYSEYYPNGSIAFSGEYCHDFFVNNLYGYYPNGSLRFYKLFLDSLIFNGDGSHYSNDNLDKLYRCSPSFNEDQVTFFLGGTLLCSSSFYVNGKVDEISNYDSLGRRHGQSIVFDVEGNICRILEFEHGKKIKDEVFKNR